MSTLIRPELSQKNPYWISKHRYYELKHFCLQYPTWKRLYESLANGSPVWPVSINSRKSNKNSDPVTKYLDERLYFAKRIDMVEKAAKETDAFLSSYILKGVTKGMPYDCLNAQENIPCCKDVYYDLYRRFFWILDKARK